MGNVNRRHVMLYMQLEQGHEMVQVHVLHTCNEPVTP